MIRFNKSTANALPLVAQARLVYSPRFVGVA
jgi:hypothetical protein